MESEVVQAMRCESCGHEFARVERKLGKEALIVHAPEMEVLCVGQDPKRFVAVCPKCQRQTEVDPEILRRF